MHICVILKRASSKDQGALFHVPKKRGNHFSILLFSLALPGLHEKWPFLSLSFLHTFFTHTPLRSLPRLPPPPPFRILSQVARYEK
jgi:hypothetical protein